MDKILADTEVTIIDVRTPAEFLGGNVVGSVNIPLQDIPRHIDRLRHMKLPLVLCCATGNRSGIARHFLMGRGIDSVNAGSWLDVADIKTRNTQEYV